MLGLVGLVGCQTNKAEEIVDLTNFAKMGQTEQAFDLTLEGFPLKKPIEVRVMGPSLGVVAWEQMPFWQALTEATNIHFVFNTPDGQDFSREIERAFLADTISDVIFAGSLTNTRQVQYGSSGQLLPLQDLIKSSAPNLEKLLNDNPHIRKSITAPDGNIYALPTINQSYYSVWPVGPLYYNGSYLAYLNEDIPTTLDEFTALMFRFRNEMPAYLGVDRVYPISSADGMAWLRLWLLSVYGMTTRTFEVFDDEVVFNALTDNYREFLEWMHMMYEEGILHPDIYTLTTEEQAKLGKENRVGLFQAWESTDVLDIEGVSVMHNPMFRPLSSHVKHTPVLPVSQGFSTGQLSITSKAAHPEEIMAMIDFLYTPEGHIFAEFGPEGSYWVFEENKNGQQVRVLAPELDPEDALNRGRVTPFFGIPAPGLITKEMPRVLKTTDEPTDDATTDFLKQETEETMGRYGKVSMPNVMLTTQEVNLISTKTSDIVAEVNLREMKFVTGVVPINDDTWEAYKASIGALGIDKLREVWQGAYDRVKDTHK